MLTNDERAALREAHRPARWTVRRDVPLCETCEGPFPCSTVRLLDALDDADATYESDMEAERLAHRDTLTHLRAETARADAAAESLGGMVEWQAEVIIDTRDALRVGGCGEHFLTAEQMGALEAATRILARERNADPSRFDRMMAERDEARAALDRVRALHAQESGVILRCRTCGLGYPCATVRAISVPASPAVTHACPEHHRTDCGCDLSAIDGGAS